MWWCGSRLLHKSILLQLSCRFSKKQALPDGVINMVNVDGPVGGKVMAEHPDFVGVHFTGSTEVFKKVWKAIGDNVMIHNTYPKIVGETGGKDFVMVHKSANPKEVAVALSRGAFEYQGQKCSAASRAYIPRSLWPEIKEMLLTDLSSFQMGGPEDFRNFINAVIDEKAFDKITGYIDSAKKDGIEVLAGGNYDKTKGYFIRTYRPARRRSEICHHAGRDFWSCTYDLYLR